MNYLEIIISDECVKYAEHNIFTLATSLYEQNIFLPFPDEKNPPLNTILEYAEQLLLAICSPNCVQIRKGRDRKAVLCRTRYKKMLSQRQDFPDVFPTVLDLNEPSFLTAAYQ